MVEFGLSCCFGTLFIGNTGIVAVGMSSNLEGDLTAGKAFTVRVGNLKNVSYDNFSGKITTS